MAQIAPVGAALRAAGRHRHAPKALLAIAILLVVLAFLLGLRITSESRAEALPLATPPSASDTTAPDGTSPGAVTPELDELAGSGEGVIAGVEGQRFRLAVAAPAPAIAIGEPDRLRVTVTNPTNATLSLQTVTTTALDPSAPGCRAQWLEIGDYVAGDEDPVLIPAQGTTVITLPLLLVNLPETNQDACKDAGFPIRLTGTARLT